MQKPGVDPGEDALPILELFERGAQMRIQARALLEQVEAMALIAINASIAAKHSDTNREAFGVLAGEVSRLAKQMEGAVTRIQTHAEGLAKRSLLCVVKSASLDKYLTTAPRVSGEENQEVIGQAIAAMRATIDGLLADYRRDLAEVTSRLRDVTKLAAKSGVTSTYFRIEGSRDEEASRYFETISDSIAEASAELQRALRVIEQQLAGLALHFQGPTTLHPQRGESRDICA